VRADIPKGIGLVGNEEGIGGSPNQQEMVQAQTAAAALHMALEAPD
jgi:hypothetical protein